MADYSKMNTNKMYIAPAGHMPLAAVKGINGEWIELTSVEDVKIDLDEEEEEFSYGDTFVSTMGSTSYTVTFSIDGMQTNMKALQLIFGNLNVSAEKTKNSLDKMTKPDDGFEPGVNCLF